MRTPNRDRSGTGTGAGSADGTSERPGGGDGVGGGDGACRGKGAGGGDGVGGGDGACRGKGAGGGIVFAVSTLAVGRDVGRTVAVRACCDGSGDATSTKPNLVQFRSGSPRRRSLERRSECPPSRLQRRSPIHRRSKTTPRRSGRDQAKSRSVLNACGWLWLTTKRYGGTAAGSGRGTRRSGRPTARERISRDSSSCARSAAEIAPWTWGGSMGSAVRTIRPPPTPRAPRRRLSPPKRTAPAPPRIITTHAGPNSPREGRRRVCGTVSARTPRSTCKLPGSNVSSPKSVPAHIAPPHYRP
jgi:hypothetical protein